jgi:hypothetical protein
MEKWRTLSANLNFQVSLESWVSKFFFSVSSSYFP